MGNLARLGIVFIVILFASNAAAQAPAEEIQKQVDAVFAAFDKPGSPGCALGVIRDGHLIQARGYTVEDIVQSVLK